MGRCVEKRKAYWRERYKTDPEYRKQQLANRKVSRNKVRDRSNSVIFDWKKAGCVVCGEKELCCLAAHHVDPTKKEFAISTHRAKLTVDKLKEELSKCICVCHNCHSKIHAGLIKVDAGWSSSVA